MVDKRPSAVSRKPTCFRVLVVDDNPDIVASTMALLSIEGYDSKPCYSGAAVFDCVKEFDPDVVLLDIGLPGQSGWECARQIRDRIPGKRPVLIAITGELVDSRESRAKLSSFDYFFAKPADPRALMAILESLRNAARDRA